VTLACIIMTFTNVIGTTTLVFGISYGTSKGYGIGFASSDMLWVTLIANIAAVMTIPIFGALSDRVGRRVFMIGGGLAGGLLSGLYLWAVQQHNFALVIVLIIVVQGILFQMWNATFATFYQEQFPMRIRVTGFAVSQNIGLMIASFFPSIFTAIAPPGTTNVPVVIGSVTFGITVVAAVATLLVRETRGTTLADLEGASAPAAQVHAGTRA
jgi:MFS family permease